MEEVEDTSGRGFNNGGEKDEMEVVGKSEEGKKRRKKSSCRKQENVGGWRGMEIGEGRGRMNGDEVREEQVREEEFRSERGKEKEGE